MSLINCTECNHPMSSEATICPNCNKPRTIGNIKQCNNCGKTIEARKKKCPECGAFQERDKTTLKVNKMANQKNSTSSLGPILVGVLIGAAAMFFYTTQLAPPDSLKATPDMARVSNIDGIRLFMESEPLDRTSYEVLGQVNVENYISQMENSNKNKKMGKAFLDMLSTTVQNIDYKEKLKLLIDATHEQFQDATGIIIRGNLRTGTAIKLK